jgi:hypothetical protein
VGVRCGLVRYLLAVFLAKLSIFADHGLLVKVVGRGCDLK